MSRVVHFEIAADDPERAVKFYQTVFGWDIRKWEGPMPYWLIMTGPDNMPGINGAIMKREVPLTGSQDLRGYRCTMDVDSVDKVVSVVNNAGGQVVAEKMAVPGVGWLAFCQDTEQNIFGLMEADEAAK